MTEMHLLQPVEKGVVLQWIAEQNRWSIYGGSFLVFILSFLIYRLLLHPLSHLPGPFLAKLSGLWRTYRYFSGTWHEDVLWLHKKYGRVVRIAPNEVSIVDGPSSKRLYGHGKPAKKTTWYNTWEQPNTGPGFFATQDQKLHAGLRKRVSAAYSMTAILGYEQYIQECLDLCLSRFARMASRNELVDMSEWTNMFAYDVVGEIAYGSQLGLLQNGEDKGGLMEAIFTGFYLMSNVGHLPGQMWIFQNSFFVSLARMFGIENPMLKFKAWTENRVILRREGKEGSARKDMLTHFLNAKNDQGQPLTHGEVMIEAMNIIGAGADTTSIGIRSCLYYICNDSRVYHKLQQELDSYSQNLSGPLQYTQALTLPYLQACIKEATRLLPSIVYQLLRYCPEGGLTIDGKFVPEGTPVGLSPIAQNRDKALWGEDAEEFIPERWLDDPEKAKLYESVTMTFGGSGPRTCVGSNIAKVEMSKFVGQLLYNFDVEFVDKSKPWTVFTAWFAYQKDMMMRLKQRSSSNIA